MTLSNYKAMYREEGYVIQTGVRGAGRNVGKTP